MKEITLEQFADEAREFVETSQHERVLVTQNGKPVALLVGIKNKDEEDFQLEASPEFWRMIEERRKRPSVRLADVKAELLADERDE